jgi:hypothetical protein
MYLCRTQAIVSDDLGMVNYAAYSTPKGEMKTRDIKVHPHQIIAQVTLPRARSRRLQRARKKLKNFLL